MRRRERTLREESKEKPAAEPKKKCAGAFILDRSVGRQAGWLAGWLGPEATRPSMKVELVAAPTEADLCDI